MAGNKGSVKLFGKTIQVLTQSSTTHLLTAEGGGGAEQEKTSQTRERDEHTDSEESSKPGGATENHKQSPSSDQEAFSKPGQEDKDEDQNGGSKTQEKTLKKPDKILPCPRCNSQDTKFCYFNNYNVNQPRHFCRNCQRYWTAGGTMRNVPVGAGRRKNKSSCSHLRHTALSEANTLQTVRPEIPYHYPNGNVLNFGPDRPLRESMAMLNCRKNGGDGNDHSSGSSATGSSSAEDGDGATLQEPWAQGFQHYPMGSPWPYQWNPIAPFCPSTPPYWGCSLPVAWNIPWLPTPSARTQDSVPNSLLGKHSRDGHLLKKKDETSLLIPATLKIDDPDKAAKSSMWVTMGIKNGKGGGLFKGFQMKAETASEVLHPNPAAMSRSLQFQESL